MENLFSLKIIPLKIVFRYLTVKIMVMASKKLSVINQSVGAIMRNMVNPKQTSLFDSFDHVLSGKVRDQLLEAWAGMARHWGLIALAILTEWELYSLKPDQTQLGHMPAPLALFNLTPLGQNRCVSSGLAVFGVKQDKLCGLYLWTTTELRKPE